jgi:hypothetical protein
MAKIQLKNADISMSMLYRSFNMRQLLSLTKEPVTKQLDSVGAGGSVS